jgi:hypothetical protein
MELYKVRRGSRPEVDPWEWASFCQPDAEIQVRFREV